MLRKTLLILLVSIICISCDNSDKKQTSVVSASALNIRKDASVNSEIIGKLYKGDIVSIDTIINDFAYITFKDQKGFVAKEYLTTNDKINLRGLFKSLTFFERILLAIALLVISIAFFRLIGYLFCKFFPMDFAGFEKTITTKDGFIGRKYNNAVYVILGKKSHHPFLNYWIYISFYWILIPYIFVSIIFIIQGISETTLFSIKIYNIQIEEIIMVLLTLMMILVPPIMFFVKAFKHSKNLSSTKRMGAIFSSIIISLPLILITHIYVLLYFSIVMFFKMAIIFLSIAASFSRGMAREYEKDDM